MHGLVGELYTTNCRYIFCYLRMQLSFGIYLLSCPFTGQTLNNETRYYSVKVTPADGIYWKLVSTDLETPCLYAGNQ